MANTLRSKDPSQKVRIITRKCHIRSALRHKHETRNSKKDMMTRMTIFGLCSYCRIENTMTAKKLNEKVLRVVHRS